MAEWRIERLASGHLRDAFCCGKRPLDEFLRRLVSQYEKRNLGRSYVAVRPGEKQVLGYYTIASGSVRFQNLPAPAGKKLPKHPVPVLLLARLAVDQSVQGQGLGEALLLDAFARAHALSAQLGIHAVEVDTIDEPARAFYEKYGFVPLLDDPFHLFLPMTTIQAALEA